ncbi:putative conserved glycine-rich protein [Diplodia seriata]|uniref:Putative conserved glycine-rich protein n=1 Tax=Diplodia seriata TaxID=420778 RepID=A0A0G2EPM3_9PEZI|nr:putative conserved glycine-rich protein [Diplodia seriata]
MRLLHTVVAFYAGASAVSALSIPRDVSALAVRATDDISTIGARAASLFDSKALEKRKGGGGRGGGSSSGSSSSGSGGRSGGSSSSSGSSSSGRTSSSSNTGGRTSSGSGTRPAYGGGAYYGGGSSVPYSAGKASPRGISPFLFPLAALAFLPAIWLASSAYGAYGYHYNHPYSFRNTSDPNNNGTNTTLPVECYCQKYTTCGCDDNNDTAYYASLVGNGSYDSLNKSLVTVARVNGTDTLLINGVLPNGTTASGGSDSAAPPAMAKFGGWWAFITLTVYAVCFL